MKVFAISILLRSSQGTAKVLAVETDLSTFSFFQRGSVQEFMGFFSVTAAERTQPGVRQKIESDNYVGNVYTRVDGLSAVMITDGEYPTRVAFSALNRLLEEFAGRFPQSQWASLTPAQTQPAYPELKTHLQTFQNPEGADPFLRVQRELDDTKIVLHKTMQTLLERGEKLDDLVAKSDQLSTQSKVFFKAAKDNNKCCSYL
ncbi:Longin-like domain-containing protein [Polychytrium aggregatum]|uniref:Longin-like domain-containing protein n=1 Tax=Polychytrium aggregatum TaxID=110093 RepID=UPI0022FEDB12|nr:Longin-like domain-containing protein [Polychytrium aggregatum]KAI9209069.1 Longin-like domain-containing protein [Polychytrium aggregatum]